MSTFFNDIQAALDTQLATIASTNTIDWEFTPANLSATTNYLRPTFIPGDTTQASLGVSGIDYATGLYQVDVFTRRATGRSAKPDVIADLFKRGTHLTYNGITVRIMSVSIRVSNSEDNYTITPVVIRWEIHTPARS